MITLVVLNWMKGGIYSIKLVLDTVLFCSGRVLHTSL